MQKNRGDKSHRVIVALAVLKARVSRCDLSVKILLKLMLPHILSLSDSHNDLA